MPDIDHTRCVIPSVQITPSPTKCYYDENGIPIAFTCTGEHVLELSVRLHFPPTEAGERQARHVLRTLLDGQGIRCTLARLITLLVRAFPARQRRRWNVSKYHKPGTPYPLP